MVATNAQANHRTSTLQALKRSWFKSLTEWNVRHHDCQAMEMETVTGTPQRKWNTSDSDENGNGNHDSNENGKTGP